MSDIDNIILDPATATLAAITVGILLCALALGSELIIITWRERREARKEGRRP